MTQSESVLIVIPTFNEAENIDTVLSKVRHSFPEGNILVVDDNSPDKTADLAEKVNERLGNIEVLRRPGKNGLGAAYRAGFAWGLERNYTVLVEMDADLSHNPDDLQRLIGTLHQDNADLVIGSRYVPGGAIPGWPMHRLLLSRSGGIFTRMMLGMKVADVTAGFRAYRASKLREIDLDAVRAEGYGFQIEMAYRLWKKGGVIREIPVTFIDRIAGDSKMSPKIIVEAFALVAMWGVRDFVTGAKARLESRRAKKQQA